MPTMKQRLLGGVALFALLDASGALAAEPMPSWTGFYFGGHAGYSWGSVNGDTTETVLIPQHSPFNFMPNSVAFSALERDLNPNGGLGGIQVGYNFQATRVVYGLEADLSWTGKRDSFDFNGRKNNLNFEDFIYQETLAAKLQYMGTVRGRIGYAFGDFLPFFTGGFAWGQMKMDLSWAAAQKPTGCPACTPFATASFSGSQAETLVGWTIGAGFEYAFATHWSAKVEYLYVDLGKETYFSGVPGGGAFGLQDHIVRLGINFRL
jgi:outer membrane immunogenic protein